MPDYGTSEYHEYIALRREEMLAQLTVRQRIARHWAWFGRAYLIAVASLVLILGAGLVAFWVAT